MDSSYKKLQLIFLLIIALPTVIFSIYQIGSYKENEEVINAIYNNQLDAILYSVNQYSNDVIHGWAAKLDIICNASNIENEDVLNIIKNELPGVHTLFQYNLELDPLLSLGKDKNNLELHSKVTNLLRDSSKTLKKLERYIKANYRKIEPFDLNDNNIQLLVFLIKKLWCSQAHSYFVVKKVFLTYSCKW